MIEDLPDLLAKKYLIPTHRKWAFATLCAFILGIAIGNNPASNQPEDARAYETGFDLFEVTPTLPPEYSIEAPPQPDTQVSI